MFFLLCENQSYDGSKIKYSVGVHLAKFGPFGTRLTCRNKTETISQSFEDFFFSLPPRELKGKK